MQAPIALCIAIEKAINGWLALDEDNQQRLVALEGKTIALHITLPDIQLYFISESPVLRVQSFSDVEPDAAIKGSVLALTKMSANKNDTRSLFSGDVHISGDTSVAEAFAHCLSGSGIDWEEHLSHIIGDVATHQAGRALRSTSSWLQETLSTIEKDASEYFKDEIQALPQPEEVRQWIEDVDTLRDDCERLAMRIQRLRDTQDSK